MGNFKTQHRRLIAKTLICLVAGITPLILFRYSDVLQGFELRVRSFLIYERGERIPHNDVFLVTVDDQTLQHLGWPLPRQQYAELIRTLNQYGAKVITFDLFFQDQLDRGDDSLAAASKRWDNVIHAFWMRGSEHQDEPAAFAFDSLYTKYAIHPQNTGIMKFFSADTAYFPHPRFASAFAQIGVTTLVIDEAERFQKLPLVFKYAGKTYPSISLLALCKYLDTSPDSVRFDHNFWGYRLRFNNMETAYEIPIDRQGQAMLNFYGTFDTFPTYSVWQIHQAVQDLKAGRAPQVHLAGLKGKVVFIGGEQMGGDTFVTPFSAAFPGVGIFATAVSNFLNGETLRTLPWYVDLGLVLMLTLVLNGGLLWANKIHKAQATVYASLIVAVILLLYNGFAYEILFKQMYIAPRLLATNGALLAVFFSVLFYEKSWHEKVLKQKVGRLEIDMQNTLDEIGRLNDKIAVRDDEFKTMGYLIAEFEEHFSQVSAEVTKRLESPLEKMKLIKDKVYAELENLRATKEHLEKDNKSLATKIEALQNGETAPVTPHAVSAPPVVSSWKRLEEATRVMEHYRAFERKAAVKHHYDPKFGMVTPVLNGHLNGEIRKIPMLEILEQIPQIASFDSTVLLTGASGTGKEKIARAIHQHSRRKQGPFEDINVPALPGSLIEDELFGHDKNAFTDAKSEREGAFERANGGTIFLDEIGDLKLEFQVHLLRVLQEKTLRRVGGNKPVKVDVRIIAATNKDLEQLIREGKFREDLYYRLNVARLHLPPLRERKEEIPHLVHYFLAKLNEDNHRQKRITDDALNALILYDWPGNIRELQNFIENAYTKKSSDVIRLDDLNERIQDIHRDVFNDGFTKIWEDLVKTAKTEMEHLLSQCQDLVLAGGIETALQTGQLQFGGIAYKNCFDYMKACLDNKGSSFQPDERETLAKQTIVALAEQLAEWCRSKKFNTMDFCWKEIEKLLGRTRRMIAIWKDEVGLPPFAATT
ncbi:MAG: Anaerobic nitric oxide reductase transcription regulator NorR [bacterium]|nr:Anaerobic nitric oxide reductase transcription regulator NorR [bacterium]